MTKYIGRLVNVGISKESSRGTAVAASFWVPKTAVAFFDKATKGKPDLSYGVIGNGADAPMLMQHSEGTIEGDMLDKMFGLILLAAFGATSPAGPSDSAYTHTFTLAATNTHQSLTLTLTDPDRADQYPLAMLDSLEINIVPDEVVKFVANFVSRPGRAIAIPSASYTAQSKFLGRHAIIKIASLASGLAAASALSIKSLKLKINKNVFLNNIVGTVHPDDIINQKFEIGGEFVLDLTDQVYRQYMLDGSYKALRIQLSNPDTLIGATSIPVFTLDLSRVHFDQWEPTRDNDAIVTQKITFEGLYDITNGNIINSCTLINGQSSY